MTYSTDQEAFWAGDFGTEYIARNRGDALLAANLSFFSRSLRQVPTISSCVEFGPNIGMNLRALQLLRPGLDAFGVEINEQACQQLAEVIGSDRVLHTSILEFQPDRSWELALIKGVLIHLNPDVLPSAYDKLVDATDRFLLVAEYYNPSPVAIPYRGHTDRLFKRDFAGELMDRHPDVRLIDYGFAYHRDPAFPQDDITWFLMEKT